MGAGFADQVLRVPKSPELGATLERAYLYAGEQGHAEVVLDHLLLALSEDPDAAAVLAASEVDVDRLRDDVAGFVSRNTDRLPDGAEAAPYPSEELLRVIDAAAAASSQSRRGRIDGAVLLAALVGDGRSPAAELLRAHGLTFESVVGTLRRGPAGSPPRPSSPARADAPRRSPPSSMPRAEGRAPKPPPAKRRPAAERTSAVRRRRAGPADLFAVDMPRRMRKGRAEHVEIGVSRHALEVERPGGERPRPEIKAVSLRLRAPGRDFAIEPLSPETLWLDEAAAYEDDRLGWRFQVTPAAPGMRRLAALASLRHVGGDGLSTEVGLPEQVIEVRVGRNYGRLARRLVIVLAAMLIGSALGAMAVGLVRFM